MIANFVQLLSGRVSPSVERAAFIQEVRIADREVRNPRVERLILICWLLIAFKHVAIIWAVQRYAVPIHQLWVNAPTWLLGALATGIYYGKARR